MSITSLNDDLNIISSLPDSPGSPNYSAQSLKAKFDEAGNKIKNYINNTLIPSIDEEIANASFGEQAGKFFPRKKLIVSYTSAGTFEFNTSNYDTVIDFYDVVLIGGGGGGVNISPYIGGGGGDAVKLEGVKLDGLYSITVGASGAVGCEGSPSVIFSESESDYIGVAFGGGAGNSYNKVGKGAGICGADSVFGDGTTGYGHGGDCYGYGKGVRGGAISDDVSPATGYGGGGWGSVQGTGGAVFIYGYVKEE